MKRRSIEIALLSIFAIIPTVLGYILGPLTHQVNRLFAIITIPGLSTPGIPGTLHLGFSPLVTVTILARSYLGRGGALKESVLLAITGVIFHPGEPAIIRVLKDILLGLGVEITYLFSKSKNVATGEVLVASFVGGLLSYLPYLLFTPFSLYLLPIFYVSLLILMNGYLISCLIGGVFASIILKRAPSISKLVTG